MLRILGILMLRPQLWRRRPMVKLLKLLMAELRGHQLAELRQPLMAELRLLRLLRLLPMLEELLLNLYRRVKEYKLLKSRWLNFKLLP